MRIDPGLRRGEPHVGLRDRGLVRDWKAFKTLRSTTTRITMPVLIVGLVAVALRGLSHAGPPDRPRGQGVQQDQTTTQDRTDEKIRPSGLQPVFPDQARCPGIASPFGAQTRYDGSPRPQRQFGGYHGGIDISLAERTPLLALAAGTVVSKGQGGQLEGIYLWLRHSPDDTGLAYWVWSKYQHLQSLPELAIGARVAIGQVVARSGRTGTIGGHYGPHGYPHLHLTTRRSPAGDYQIVGSGMPAPGSHLIDPVVVYSDASARPHESAVTIPYVSTDGQIWPQGTRVLWPIACQPR